MSQSDKSSETVRKLAYLFRAHNAPRPVFLLGAGASFRSGIPLAEEAVRKIAQVAYARNKLGKDIRACRLMPSDWKPYLEEQAWFLREETRFAENFPLAVENLLTPQEFRRTFFHELIQPSEPISSGYDALARMMTRKLAGTVLTTNFDRLIAEALRGQIPKPPLIVEIKTPDDLVTFRLDNNAQIVYLHGSVEHYSDRNLRNETERLDDELVERIRPLLRESPVIVVGYRGAEPSVMQHLFEEGIEECGGYKNGIYWCQHSSSQPHEAVQSLRQKVGTNFMLLEADGFDELMVSLDQELANDSWYTGRVGLSAEQEPLDAQRFDAQPLENKSLADLDHDLIQSTLAQYAKRLKWPEVNRENYLSFLEGQGFLRRKGDNLIPTKGCFLLFGIAVEKTFPQARVSFTQNGKKRVVIEGNLVTQHRRILDLLTTEEVNPRIRLKGERSAEEQPAYPTRALTELTVNLLVHRDYESQQFSCIEFSKGRSLKFENPGGLMPNIRRGVQPDSNGKFSPVRGLTEMRNPLIADVFYGIGSMDKAGSGLVDVQDLLLEFGGRAEYTIDAGNLSVQVAVYQPFQEAPETSRVARRVVRTELFVTNLIPFRVLPKSIYALPLRRKFVEAPLFDGQEDARDIPLVIRHSEMLWSFANLLDYTEFSRRRGFVERIQEQRCEEMWQKTPARNLFVWLLNKHWEFFLRQYPLIVEPRRKRAFFYLAGKQRATITYTSRTGRRATREVVKKRGEEPNAYHENEAIRYSVEEFFGEWALQLRPSYVFTRRDGETPLSAALQTRRATSRFKFDRNPSVDDDLTFWVRYLSSAQAAISLGNIGVTDLILDSEFCSAEVPKSDTEKGRLEAAN